MKKIYALSLAAALCSFAAQAQITKGTILLGGSIGVGSEKQTNQASESKRTSFNIAPSIGFAVKENRVIGISLLYGHSKVDNGPGNTRVSDGYGGGLYYRRYFGLGRNFYAFGQGNARYIYSKSKDDASATGMQSTDHTAILSVEPGIAYALSPRFHLELGLANLVTATYSSSKSMYTGQPSSSYSRKAFDFSANADPGSQLFVAFRILIP